MLTLLGTVFGGLFRLAPEILKFFTAKEDRAHELAMFDKQLEADRLRGAMRMEELREAGQQARDAGELAALIEATRAQGKKTGIPAIDAINSLVRPVLTFWWCIILYSVALGCEYYALVALQHVPAVDAVLKLWGEDEKAIVASIISFWFVDRSLRKK
jgi:hypothetical protein